jgi:hypothetical protein
MKYLIDFNNYSTQLLTEAFTYEDMESVIVEIERIFQSKLGKLYKIPVQQPFLRNGESEIKLGLQYFTEDNNSFRLNWSESWGSSIESVDIYNGSSSYPALTLDTKGLSIVKIIPQICALVKNIDEEVSVKFTKDLIEDDIELSENFIDILSEARTKGALGKKTIKALHSGKLPIERGKKEKNMDPAIDKGEKLIKTIKYADPETIFNDMKDLCDLVINGITPSLLVTGMPGIGKTHHVMQALERNGKKKDSDYIVIKGTTSPFGLYVTLYENNNKIIIFDDCDSVFKDEVSSNILKGALDSYDKRIISWRSMKTLTKGGEGDVPSSFEFKGSIIFVSNLNVNKIEEAIRTRSFVVDITLRATDIVRIMETALPDLIPEYSIEKKKEVLNYLKENVEGGKNENINMRTLIKSIRLRQSNKDSWKRLIDLYSY